MGLDAEFCVAASGITCCRQDETRDNYLVHSIKKERIDLRI